MRLVLFLQVVLLLALAAYVVLLQLENPLTVRLPMPWGPALPLPLGAVLGLAVAVGALYMGLLLVPPAVRRALAHRRERRERDTLERRLSATLQAKLAGAELGASPPPDPPGDPALLAPDDAPGRGA